MSQAYVVGFLFDEMSEHVVLIQKNKPAWKAGKLNGVGGKIEPGESPLEAMIREFREEAGKTIGDWEEFFVLTVPGSARVHFFKAFKTCTVATQETEKVGWFPVRWVCQDTHMMPNLRWLIPMALDPQRPVGVAENQA